MSKVSGLCPLVDSFWLSTTVRRHFLDVFRCLVNNYYIDNANIGAAMTTYSDRILVNQTGQDLRDFAPHFFAFPEVGALPDELADLFDVRLFNSEETGKLHIIVNFSDD